MDYRGHFGTILPQAQALINAAHLRGDRASAQLAQRQLEWIIGRNPFSQSTMWGEGYDFPPLYTPSSGDMVGALPVGIQTRTFLPGGTYNLDLRPGRALDWEVSQVISGTGEVTIKVSVRGNGSHRFGIRADNLTLTDSPKELVLKPGSASNLEWRGRIRSPDTPWVAVVVPDDDLSLGKEVMGTPWER